MWKDLGEGKGSQDALGGLRDTRGAAGRANGPRGREGEDERPQHEAVMRSLWFQAVKGGDVERVRDMLEGETAYDINAVNEVQLSLLIY